MFLAGRLFLSGEKGPDTNSRIACRSKNGGLRSRGMWTFLALACLLEFARRIPRKLLNAGCQPNTRGAVLNVRVIYVALLETRCSGA